jgi:hypothetical protein
LKGKLVQRERGTPFYFRDKNQLLSIYTHLFLAWSIKDIPQHLQ